MAYQYRKDQDLPGCESGAEDPYAILFHQLTGIQLTKPPKKQPAYNIFSKANFDTLLKPLVDAACALEPARKRVSIVSEVTQWEFSKLPMEERDVYEQESKDVHLQAVKEHRDRCSAPISRSPEDRQR